MPQHCSRDPQSISALVNLLDSFSPTLLDKLGPDLVRRSPLLPLLANEQRAEMLLRFVRVMRATSQLQVHFTRRATIGKGRDVMKFQQASFVAAALRSDKRALASIALPDSALDSRRNVT